MAGDSAMRCLTTAMASSSASLARRIPKRYGGDDVRGFFHDVAAAQFDRSTSDALDRAGRRSPRVSPGARWKVPCESTALLRPMELAVHDHSPTIHGTMQGVTRITEGEAVLWECRLPFPNP